MGVGEDVFGPDVVWRSEIRSRVLSRSKHR